MEASHSTHTQPTQPSGLRNSIKWPLSKSAHSVFCCEMACGFLQDNAGQHPGKRATSYGHLHPNSPTRENQHAHMWAWALEAPSLHTRARQWIPHKRDCLQVISAHLNLLCNAHLNMQIIVCEGVCICFFPTDPIHGGLPRWLRGKQLTCQCWRCAFNPWVGKIPWSRKWQPTPGFLPGESHGQRSLAGYPWGHKSQTRLSH